MKTTSYFLIVLTIAFSNLGRGAPAIAGLSVVSQVRMLSATVLGQAGSSKTDAKSRRRQADDLVRQARQAMADENFEIAESLLERAEKLDARYGILHLGDRPDKARRDMTRLRRKAKTPGLPSERFSLPFTSGDTANNKPPAEDPFRANQITKGQLTLKDEKRTATRFLTMGRKQLMEGNLAGAANLYERSASLEVTFGPQEDSPQKLLNDIRRAGGHVEEYVKPAQRPGPNFNGASSASRQPATASFPANGSRAQHGEGANPFDVTDQRPLPTLAREEVFRTPGSSTPPPFNVSMDPPTGSRNIPATAQRIMPPSERPSRRPLVDAIQPPDRRGFADPASKQNADFLTAQARKAMAAGQLDEAKRLANQAMTLKVPEDAFAPNEDTPRRVLVDLARARSMTQTVEAGGVVGRRGNSGESNAVYQQLGDPTSNSLRPARPVDQRPLANQQPLRVEGQSTTNTPRISQRPPAPEQLPEMVPLREETRQQGAPGVLEADARRGESILENTARQQEILTKKLLADVNRGMSEARRLQETDPKQGFNLLQITRQKIATSGLDPISRDKLLRRLDAEIQKTDRYITENRALIDLEERNDATLAEIEHERKVKVEVQQRVAELVDDFNKLMDEQRFPEAEIVAKRAAELMPNEAIVVQLKNQVKFTRRFVNNQDLADRKERGFHNTLDAVVESSIPHDDRYPLIFPNLEDWNEMSNVRKIFGQTERVQRSEKEIEILQRLRTPVLLQYENAPLEEVLRMLADYAKVNLHIDPQGLAEEGVTATVPVNINLTSEIMLKSALNLILEPLHLSYVVRNEVLEITSEQMREGDLKRVTYYVADLVTPIPNFVPSNRMGLASSLLDAYAMIGSSAPPLPGGMRQAPVGVLATGEPEVPESPFDQNILAQAGGGIGGGGGSPMAGFGPGGAGGGAQADFDSLIELITTTVQPTTWDEVGGSGAIQEFATNLSLVISQTEEVHDEIVDLLEQLRRLQDLQVTIEVRFITLNDSFFERIGIDFDFDIDDNIDKPFQVFGRPDPNFAPSFDNSGSIPGRDVQDRDHGESVTVGLSAPGVFSADLDVPFRQGNFDLAVPQFGGFDPTAGAQLGFAILSDLEAFFFINAAQADRRSNILQAPKVTLFNGQSAFVADTSQSPFVISVIPVVGDFAAAQQPVIVVLSQGTMLTVQATVSSDRRFVRLTLVPFFSTIGDVNTFTFNGSTDTQTDTSQDGPDNSRQQNNTTRTVTSGTTVQLPTFAFITVATTVSVPDGGSVLLGGIKRLSEGRTEAGVPFLNKLPYVSRFFKNVGIGRETTSLMMMVTPRIIIQEEEEALLGAISGS